jgi:peptidoglycan/xylan/chitin deacetylase (PgdA/CDA1 family)
MFSQSGFMGGSLPPKTLCLTYDDGPGATDGDGLGPHSLELAQFLSDQGIRATFFNIGQHAAQYPDVVSQVHDLGHLIGNHTLDHPSLPDYLTGGGDVYTEVAYTDGYIREWVDSPTVFFRPPYGNWSADLANTLNKSLAVCRDHVGPILWDIDGQDWLHWRNKDSVDTCLKDYVDKINATQRGIVLMHDSSWDLDIKENENTFALTQQLIPILKGQGYQFVRLDEIPEIQAAAQAPLQVSFQAFNGNYVSVGDLGTGEMLMNAAVAPLQETFTVESLGFDRVALKASNGLYVSPQGGGADSAPVMANGPAVGPWEPLKIVTVGLGKVAFETVNGYYLTMENAGGGRFMANSPWIRQEEVFSINVQ